MRRESTLVLGPAVAAALALWLTNGMWAGGPPVGDDMVAHLVRAEYGIEHLLKEGRVDGWQTSFALGYQEYLFIGPILTWCVALVDALSLGTLSTLTAFKVVVVLSFATLPLAAWFLARSFGLSARAAGIASILALTVNSPFGGIGLSGLFGTGLTVNAAGAVSFCMALGAAMRLVTTPSRRWAVATGVATALLIATHGVSMILLGVMLPVALVLLALETGIPALIRRTIDREVGVHLRAHGIEPPATRHDPWPAVQRFTRWTVIAVVIALALSAFVLLPLTAHRDLRGIITGWAHTPFWRRLGDVWSGDIAFQRGVAPWVAVGLAFGVWRVVRRRPLALTVLLTPFVFLIIGEIFFAVAPSNVVSQQIPNRGLGYAALLAVFPLAALLDAGTTRLGLVGDAGAIGVAIALVVIPLGTLRDLPRPVRPTPVAIDAASELRRRVTPSARYAMQRDFPAEIGTFGMSHPDFWMAWASKRNTLNVFNVESSTTPGPAYLPDGLGQLPPDEVADRLARYGVTHVLAADISKLPTVSTSPRFTEVWRQDQVALLEVRARPGQPHPSSLLATSGPASARLLAGGPHDVRVGVRSSRPAVATAAIAWSPKWHLEIDGRSAPLGRSQESLLAFELPAGEHVVRLRFREDAWDLGGRILTAVALMVLLGVPLRRRLRREDPAPPDALGV